MLKNMKKIVAMALPVLTLSLTSCNRGAEFLNYEKARAFIVDTYDEHALDTVPMVYTANFNKMEANVDINYVTPDGGSDSSNIAFGFNGIHATINDRYAICLSSTLLDAIETYYSDFVAFALSIQEESPIDLDYVLIDNSITKITLATSEKMVGSLLVRLLQMAASTIDVASKVGFIPKINDDGTMTAETEAVKTVQAAIFKFVNSIRSDASKAATMTNTIIDVINYLSVTVFDSSEARGEVFHTYLTTDKYGFLRDLNFTFKSGFAINGLTSLKEYDSKTPTEGDKPKTSDPYRFTLDGSFDFDFNINAKYAK